MSILKHLVGFCFIALSSCNFPSKETCGTITSNTAIILDSLVTKQEPFLGITSVSLEMKGKIEKDIFLNGIKLKYGTIDTVVHHIDQYSTTFLYEILNPETGNIELTICASFQP